MITVIFYITLLLSFFLGFLHVMKRGELFSPAILLLIFFNIPLLFNRFEMAEIQSIEWHSYTYAVLILFNLIFIIAPLIIFLFSTRPEHKEIISIKNKFSLIEVLSNVEMSFLLFLVVVLQVVVNKLNCGLFFPLFHVDDSILNGVKYHTLDVKFWGFFISSLWYFVMILGVLHYLRFKNLIVLGLLIIAFLAPLFRLARIDMFAMFFICSIILGSNIKLNLKKVLYYISTILFFVLIGIVVMWYRTRNMELSDNGISKLIGFKYYSGPMDVFAFLYSYFSLSFENLNLFIIKNWGGFEYAYGAFTFRPILVGVLKLHVLYPGFPMHNYFNELREFLSYVAMVPTCIPEFIVDFGFKLAFIPMVIYSLLSNWLYVKAFKSQFYLIIYYSYLPAFFLASFQNLFISPRFVYISIFVICLYFFKLSYSKKK